MIPSMASLLCAMIGMMCEARIPAPVKEDRLSLRVHLDKEVYKAGDTVALEITFKNDSRDMLYLTGNHLFPDALEVGPGRYFELWIFDDKGARLHYWGENLSEGGTYWQVVPVESGRTYRTRVKLTAGSYGTVVGDQKHRLGVDAKKYRVSLRYNPPTGSGGVQKPPKDFDENRRWRGKLESNEVVLKFE